MHNGAFVAIMGNNHDGHTFIPEALSGGAKVIVAQKDVRISGDFTLILVDNSHLALAKLACAFYEFPADKLRLVGITGTNGKTTTAYLLESIFKEANLLPGIIGTINYRYKNYFKEASLTTPESLELQKILFEMNKENVDPVILEVSSHALNQGRIEGCRFNIGIFTNLTPEHLDYHNNMDNYFDSKSLLFTNYLQGWAILNHDDNYGNLLRNKVNGKTLTFGLMSTCDIKAENISFLPGGIKASIHTPVGTIPITSSLIGKHNLYNIMASVGAAFVSGITPKNIKKGIENLKKVPGRLERFKNAKNLNIFIDYAHTGNALKNVLDSLKALNPRRIITIFGCGGNRDKTKRPVMGEISGKYSDITLITSDNPRKENPGDIIKEIEAGILPLKLKKFEWKEGLNLEEKGYLTEVSRSRAIKMGISLAKPGDFVLIAGKGHECYQIMGEEKIPYNDRYEIKKALRVKELGV